MSLEHAKAFIERIKSDEAFRMRIKAIADIDDRLAAVRNEGFIFSEVEIHEAYDELSDYELDNACGGVNVFSFVYQ